jgi:predicted nucleotidyltransferase
MEQSVEKKLVEIKNTFKKYGAERAFLFGSAAVGASKKNSDVDFLFSFPSDMDPETYANNYFSLLNALRNLLNREVDLVAEKTLQNPYLIESINDSKIQLL